MWVYKITNQINDKFYIGQTTKSVDKRFARHINDALSGKLDTHLARAIRKYGPEHFSIEVIDTALTQEELTKKEYYWIRTLNAIKQGYNETEAEFKCGGNTYINKTSDEMQEIKSKISASKVGGRNPNARKVKCKSLLTGVEKHFSSASEMQLFFNQTNHTFITARCKGKIKCAFQKEWLIAYEEEPYQENVSIEKHNNKSKKIIVDNLETKEVKEFPSYAAAERYFNLPQKYLSNKAYQKGNEFVKGKFKVTILK